MEGGDGSLPYGGDLQAAMRAKDHAAVRLLMQRRDKANEGDAARRHAATQEETSGKETGADSTGAPGAAPASGAGAGAAAATVPAEASALAVRPEHKPAAAAKCCVPIHTGSDPGNSSDRAMRL